MERRKTHAIAANREATVSRRKRQALLSLQSLLIAFVFSAAGLLDLTGAHADHTAPLITSYEPSTAYPGDQVRVRGMRFGTGFSPTGREAAAVDSVKYGTRMGERAALGSVTLLGWNDTEFFVRLPDSMPPGTYWLAIYQGSDLQSNQLVGLTVRSRLERLTPSRPLLISVVTRYDPSSICGGTGSLPGPTVRVIGENFGSRGPSDTVKYGTGATPMGDAVIRSWSGTQIVVTLPPSLLSLPPNTYWLAIYRGLQPISNQLAALYINFAECAPPSPPVDFPSVEITGYSPSNAHPGDEVIVSARGLERVPAFSSTSVRYGTGTNSLGLVTPISRTDTQFRVRLPDSMPPGTYWLAIYAGKLLKSNQLRALTVTPRRLSPGVPLR